MRPAHLLAAIAVSVAAFAACKRDDRGPPHGAPPDATEQGNGNQQGASANTMAGPGSSVPPPGAATMTDPNRPFGQDPVAWLDAKYQLELPRSTVPDAAPLPWQSVTPTAPAANADTHNGPPEPAQAWTQGAVVLGRQAAFVADQKVANLRCVADPMALCAADGLRAPTGKQVLDFAPTDLGRDGSVLAVTAAAAAQKWTGQPVWLLADRRINAAAVLQTMETLRKSGAQPQLGVATLAGQIALLLPSGLMPDPVDRKPPAVPEPGQSGGVGPVPADLTAVVVHVARTGVHLEFVRTAPNPPVTPELLGNVAEALAVWAERARSAAPALTTASVQAAPDAPWEEVVRAIDALRDTCARANKGTPCHDKRPLFAHIELAIASSPTSP